jgi:hypothetical protein
MCVLVREHEQSGNSGVETHAVDACGEAARSTLAQSAWKFTLVRGAMPDPSSIMVRRDTGGGVVTPATPSSIRRSAP